MPKLVSLDFFDFLDVVASDCEPEPAPGELIPLSVLAPGWPDCPEGLPAPAKVTVARPARKANAIVPVIDILIIIRLDLLLKPYGPIPHA